MLKLIATAASIPKSYTGINKVAEAAVLVDDSTYNPMTSSASSASSASTGNLVIIAANRGHDTLCVLKFYPSTNTFNEAETSWTSTEGSFPRSFALAADTSSSAGGQGTSDGVLCCV